MNFTKKQKNASEREKPLDTSKLAIEMHSYCKSIQVIYPNLIYGLNEKAMKIPGI